LRFNDGQDVPEALLVEVVLELRHKFHALTSETQIIQGLWESEGVIFRDELIRVSLDVPDTEENQQFFVQFKEELKARFRQLDIWITSRPIKVI